LFELLNVATEMVKQCNSPTTVFCNSGAQIPRGSVHFIWWWSRCL